MSAQVGAKTVARQHHFADHQKVALSLVDVTRGYRRNSPPTTSSRIGSRFARPLGKPEPRDDGDVVRNESAIGGIDHVRQPGHRLHQVDVVTQPR